MLEHSHVYQSQHPAAGRSWCRMLQRKVTPSPLTSDDEGGRRLHNPPQGSGRPDSDFSPWWASSLERGDKWLLQCLSRLAQLQNASVWIFNLFLDPVTLFISRGQTEAGMSLPPASTLGCGFKNISKTLHWATEFPVQWLSSYLFTRVRNQ